MADGIEEREQIATARRQRQQPPLHWVALLWNTESSDWMAVHRFHARDTWQRAAGLRARAALLGRCFVWPIRAVGLAASNVFHTGSLVRERTGKARLRQFAEQWKLAVFDCVAPRAYTDFALYDEANRMTAQRYLHGFETRAPATLYRAISNDPVAIANLLHDKAAFHDRCVESGLATPRIHRMLEAESVTGPDSRAALPASDLFIKPRRGRGGRHAQAWNFDPRGAYRNVNGDRFDPANLAARLESESQARDLVVQERLHNHPGLDEICHGGALATARIVTVTNEAGRPEAVAAVFRMGTGEPIVDNAKSGQLMASVDLKTGRLGRAIWIGPRSRRHNAHRHARRSLYGESLPDWEEAIRLVVRAHKAFAGRAALEWSVGFTPSGPVLVDGDTAPCVHTLQRAYGEPLGGTRFGQLVGYHLRPGHA
ncbi:MAG: hypothetical protein GY733_12765 [bacterium]|nr:hypothetical protein [bacterium]